jgi:predicted PurR-regulated permease PerM
MDAMGRSPTRPPKPAGDDRPAAGRAPHDLSGLLGAPPWLRDLGGSAWLAVGVTLAVLAAVWLLTLTQTIVAPVTTAAVVAAVTSPLLGRLARLGRRGIGRGAAAGMLLVAMIVAGAAVIGVILGGITSQVDALRPHLAEAKDTLGAWAADVGIDRDTAASATQATSTAISDAVPALLEGLGTGIKALSSLAVFLSLTALSLFFLLKDGPLIRRWVEAHARVAPAIAHAIGDRVLESLRGYFLGVTFVAMFNAVLVGAGALVLGVPLAGTIAAITFLGAYVPYLGAWGAGAFSVLLALGGAGTEAAIAMTVIQLLANGILQQMIQPIAYGAALGIHPLAVLIVTIAGGSLFGAVGLILAAPLTAAATRIAADLSRAPASPSPG